MIWLFGTSRDIRRLEKAGDVAAIAAYLADEDSIGQRKAAKALGRLGDRAAVAPLVAFLRDPPLARGDPTDVEATGALIAAIKACVAIDDDSAAEPIAELLEHPDDLVRHTAAEALGSLDCFAGRTGLVEIAVHDEKMPNRTQAVQSLAKLGAVHQLRQVLGHPDTDGSIHAVAQVRLHRALGGGPADDLRT